MIIEIFQVVYNFVMNNENVINIMCLLFVLILYGIVKVTRFGQVLKIGQAINCEHKLQGKSTIAEFARKQYTGYPSWTR